MAAWHWLLGIGITVIVTVLNQVSSRRLTEEGHSRRRPKNYSVEPDDTCAICLEKMNPRDEAYLSCLHSFHDRCLSKLIAANINQCPKCRGRI
uniref:Putative ring finger n=1 Tax=Haematobia irritans TaxID=7368 RepID=A0A1L8EIM6_HAEIR